MNKTIFESQSRAAGNQTSAAITVAGFTGARFFLDVSVPNGGSVTPKVQALDQLSGNWVDIPAAVFAAVSTTATKTMSIRPGVAETANESVADAVADTFRVIAVVATAAVTFSMSVDLVR